MSRSTLFPALALCASALFSSVPASAQQMKIGVINLQRAILETGELKKRRRIFRRSTRPAKKRLKSCSVI